MQSMKYPRRSRLLLHNLGLKLYLPMRPSQRCLVRLLLTGSLLILPLLAVAQAFGPLQVINKPDPTKTIYDTANGNANKPVDVYAADLDGDGDKDVLSASELDDKIAWYANQGDGTFGPQKVINQPDTNGFVPMHAQEPGYRDTVQGNANGDRKSVV